MKEKIIRKKDSENKNFISKIIIRIFKGINLTEDEVTSTLSDTAETCEVTESSKKPEDVILYKGKEDKTNDTTNAK